MRVSGAHWPHARGRGKARELSLPPSAIQLSGWVWMSFSFRRPPVCPSPPQRPLTGGVLLNSPSGWSLFAYINGRPSSPPPNPWLISGRVIFYSHVACRRLPRQTPRPRHFIAVLAAAPPRGWTGRGREGGLREGLPPKPAAVIAGGQRGNADVLSASARRRWRRRWNGTDSQLGGRKETWRA